MSTALLDIENLSVDIDSPRGTLRALEGISLRVQEGQFVALVGESGSGKSITARTIIGLMPNGVKHRIRSGSIVFDGKRLDTLRESQMDTLRERELSMIFQDPMAYLNPIMTIQRQLDEAVPSTVRSRKERLSICVELLENVGLADTERILKAYPHNLSGGMRQRVLIAIALACDPTLLIADEPTTALDVTVQAKVLETLKRVAEQRRLSTLFITHDLGIVANLADYVYVMYAGQIVESGTTEEIFLKPLHPYTRGLVESVRSLELAESAEGLVSIPGHTPDLANIADGCRFASRCPFVEERCGEPQMSMRVEGRSVLCWKATQL